MLPLYNFTVNPFLSFPKCHKPPTHCNVRCPISLSNLGFLVLVSGQNKSYTSVSKKRIQNDKRGDSDNKIKQDITN